VTEDFKTQETATEEDNTDSGTNEATTENEDVDSSNQDDEV
jgi:hypothetical protein